MSDSKMLGTCPVCDTPFSFYARRPKIHCSRACKDGVGRVAVNCKSCGKLFTHYKHQPRTYCSNKCRGCDAGGYGARGAKPPRMGTCNYCAGQFINTYYDGKYCSRKCYHEYMKVFRVGENNLNWTGGTVAYYGPSWCDARRCARDRDKVCQICGKTPEQNGRELDVHHIKPFKLFGVKNHTEANELSNLVCVCVSCHHIAEKESRLLLVP